MCKAPPLLTLGKIRTMSVHVWISVFSFIRRWLRTAVTVHNHDVVFRKRPLFLLLISQHTQFEACRQNTERDAESQANMRSEPLKKESTWTFSAVTLPWISVSILHVRWISLHHGSQKLFKLSKAVPDLLVRFLFSFCYSDQNEIFILFDRFVLTDPPDSQVPFLIPCFPLYWPWGFQHKALWHSLLVCFSCVMHLVSLRVLNMNKNGKNKGYFILCVCV